MKKVINRWVKVEDPEHWTKEYCCFNCGEFAPIYWDEENLSFEYWCSPYCPRCGVKLDDVEE